MFPLALIVHFKSFFAALHNFVKFNNACVLASKMAYCPLTTCFASKGQSDIYKTIVYKSKISHLTKTTTMSKSEVFKRKYTGSSGRARSTRADSTHAQYKNVRVCIVNALKLPAKWVLFSIIHLDSTGAKSRSCGFF